MNLYSYLIKLSILGPMLLGASIAVETSEFFEGPFQGLYVEESEDSSGLKRGRKYDPKESSDDSDEEPGSSSKRQKTEEEEVLPRQYINFFGQSARLSHSWKHLRTPGGYRVSIDDAEPLERLFMYIEYKGGIVFI